jgi:hypothetical protein
MFVISHFVQSYVCCVTGLGPKPFHSSHSTETYFVTCYVLFGYTTLLYQESVTSSWPDGLEK